MSQETTEVTEVTSKPQKLSSLFPIRQGQHVLIAGTTGSGKSTLAKYLLREREYVIVIDTKHETSWQGFKTTADPKQVFQRNEEKGYARTIFRPDNSLSIEQVLYRVYQEGGWHVYIDEIYQLGRGTVQRFPEHYIRNLTSGRSRKVTVWTGTQRPRFLPLFAMTEATHFFIFQLGREDRKRLVQLSGVEELEQSVSRHGFLYYNRITREVRRERLKL